jgi:hypothetical protein
MTPMSAKTLWLCAGLVGGVLLAIGIQYAVREAPEPARAPVEIESLKREVAAARDERGRAQADLADAQAKLVAAQTANEELRKEIEKAKACMEEGAKSSPAPAGKPAEGAVKTGPPTDEELLKGIDTFGASLQAILTGQGEDAKKELRDLLARAGKHGLDLLLAKFEDDATDFRMRLFLAHALAQSGNPEAIQELQKVLADPDAGLVELRLATHGLAFSDAPGLDDSLLAVARNTADTGARANAAFGLARRKNAEGLDLYLKATDEAMANRDPAGLQYLGGFMMLGDEALPAIRQRLLTYTEPQSLVMLIEILKQRGDTGALENLRKLSADRGRPEAIRKSADGAIKVLEAAK